MKLSKALSSFLQSQAPSLLEQISSKFVGVTGYSHGAPSEAQNLGAMAWRAAHTKQFVTATSPGCAARSNEVRALTKRSTAGQELDWVVALGRSFLRAGVQPRKVPFLAPGLALCFGLGRSKSR